MLTARPRGFTLIELMFGIALLALLLVLAMPTFTTMLHNARLRGTSESILAGLQMARTEALRRNQTVEFFLTSDDLDAPGDGAGIAANTTGPGWAVRAIAPVAAYVEGRTGLEGSNQADPAALYARISATGLPATNTIQFDALGRTNAGATTSFDVMPADTSTCKASGGDMRCLRIVVTPGGRLRMCDPDPAITDANDTRHC